MKALCAAVNLEINSSTKSTYFTILWHAFFGTSASEPFPHHHFTIFLLWFFIDSGQLRTYFVTMAIVWILFQCLKNRFSHFSLHLKNYWEKFEFFVLFFVLLISRYILQWMWVKQLFSPYSVCLFLGLELYYIVTVTIRVVKHLYWCRFVLNDGSTQESITIMVETLEWSHITFTICQHSVVI